MIRYRPIRGESHVDFLGESEGSLPPLHDSFPDASEAINDFWSMSGNFIYRHHVEPRVELYSPTEESFPIPLKYIDVSRTTQTNFDVEQERRIGDYWNIDGSRDLSDYWTGFTQFILLEEKPPDGYMWSGRRLTRKQQPSRPDHLWPESNEKLNSIMQENYEEFISLVAPAMPCQISKNNQNSVTRGKSNEIKSKLACILEACESTRIRMGNSEPP